jgi:hypothetical protein
MHKWITTYEPFEAFILNTELGENTNFKNGSHDFKIFSTAFSGVLKFSLCYSKHIFWRSDPMSCNTMCFRLHGVNPEHYHPQIHLHVNYKSKVCFVQIFWKHPGSY